MGDDHLPVRGLSSELPSIFANNIIYEEKEFL